MKLRNRRLILIHSLMIPVFVMFTNCDHISQQSSGTQSSNPALLANNGGGHSGKLSYLHTSAYEGCDLSPDLAIVRDGDATRAFTTDCHNSTETSLDISKLISFDLNPYFLVYDELIYAHESVLALSATVDAHIELFCTSQKGIDVAVKTKRIRISSSSSRVEQSALIFRKGEAYPAIEEVRGVYRDPTSAGIKVFEAKSDELEIITQAPYTLSRARAEIKFSSGENVDLDCFVRYKSSSDK